MDDEEEEEEIDEQTRLLSVDGHDDYQNPEQQPLLHHSRIRPRSLISHHNPVSFFLGSGSGDVGKRKSHRRRHSRRCATIPVHHSFHDGEGGDDIESQHQHHHHHPHRPTKRRASMPSSVVFLLPSPDPVPPPSLSPFLPWPSRSMVGEITDSDDESVCDDGGDQERGIAHGGGKVRKDDGRRRSTDIQGASTAPNQPAGRREGRGERRGGGKRGEEGKRLQRRTRSGPDVLSSCSDASSSSSSPPPAAPLLGTRSGASGRTRLDDDDTANTGVGPRSSSSTAPMMEPDSKAGSHHSDSDSERQAPPERVSGTEPGHEQDNASMEFESASSSSQREAGAEPSTEPAHESEEQRPVNRTNEHKGWLSMIATTLPRPFSSSSSSSSSASASASASANKDSSSQNEGLEAG